MKTRILGSKTFFRKLCIYEVMYKNTAETDRQVTDDNMARARSILRT